MCKVCDAEGALLGELERRILENKEGNHNKQYTVYIEALEGGGYRVMGRWGPIGKWVKSQEKGRFGSLTGARGVMDDLVREKLSSKGYSYRVCEEDANARF